MSLTDSRRRQLDNPDLTADERTLMRCRLAADLIHSGQFEKAREARGELWRGAGGRPNLEGLGETTAAEVLLQCGSLSGWLGTSKKIEGAQDVAKDLISEARRLFEARGEQARVAEAEHELSVCYWRAGAFAEARVLLQEAARRLGEADVEQKAKICVRRSAVEISAGRYHDALRILEEVEPTFKEASDALKGRWHAQAGLVLRRLGTAEGRADYLDRAIIEYTAAIFHLEQAKHERYCGNNLNNLAFLLYKLGRYQEAHQHLDRAQVIFTRLRDAGNLAQVDETRARVLIAEKRYREASRTLAGVIQTLEQGGESALLADALTVQATAEARSGEHQPSVTTFRLAVAVAEAAGALESAGLAALALIEEHGGSARLPDEVLYETYGRTGDLLKRMQDAETIARLRACARVVMRRLAAAGMGADFSLSEATLRYEAKFIKLALEDAGGSVVRAARRLGMTYQKLQHLLRTRHKDLAPLRAPAQRRFRSIIKRE